MVIGDWFLARHHPSRVLCPEIGKGQGFNWVNLVDRSVQKGTVWRPFGENFSILMNEPDLKY